MEIQRKQLHFVVCPLSFVKDDMRECIHFKCAWYNVIEKQCSLVVLANVLCKKYDVKGGGV